MDGHGRNGVDAPREHLARRLDQPHGNYGTHGGNAALPHEGRHDPPRLPADEGPAQVHPTGLTLRANPPHGEGLQVVATCVLHVRHRDARPEGPPSAGGAATP